MHAVHTGLFDSVICTGQFEDMTAKSGHELVTKLTKQQVDRITDGSRVALF
jgi:hypothetical protein